MPLRACVCFGASEFRKCCYCVGKTNAGSTAVCMTRIRWKIPFHDEMNVQAVTGPRRRNGKKKCVISVSPERIF